MLLAMQNAKSAVTPKSRKEHVKNKTSVSEIPLPREKKVRGVVRTPK